MVGLGVVLGGVVALRAFGAADVAAGDTDPEDHAVGAIGEALLAEGERGRLFCAEYSFSLDIGLAWRADDSSPVLKALAEIAENLAETSPG